MCTSCSTCRFCSFKGELLCPECPQCQKACTLQLIKVANWQYLITSESIIFDLERIKSSNFALFVKFSYQSNNNPKEVIVENTNSEQDSTIEIIFPKNSMITAQCVYPRVAAFQLQFEKDDERAINSNVRKVSSVIGYTTLSTVFVSISQTNSFYSIVGLMNTNRIFGFLYIMRVPINGIMSYINKVDTMLNFNPALLVSTFFFHNVKQLEKEYIYLSLNMGEDRVKEVLLISAGLLLCFLFMILLHIGNRVYRKMKLKIDLIGFINELNKNVYFKQFSAIYSQKFVSDLKVFYEQKNSKFQKLKIKLISAVYSKENELRFFLLTAFITEFSQFFAKSCVLIKNGSMGLKTRCFFNVLFWMSIYFHLFTQCALRFFHLYYSPSLDAQRQKELILYKSIFFFVIKVFLMLFVFITLNKYFSPCLCTVIVIQLTFFCFVGFLLNGEIKAKRMLKTEALFILGLEHLLTLAIVYVWCIGYTFGESESSLIIDIVMILYNVCKIGSLVWKVLNY